MNGQVDGRDLVKQYVRELERALRDLGEEHPDEAVDEIRAHLEEGIGEANDPNVAIRLMLDLGRPEDVAASLVAGRTDGVVPAPRPLTTAARVLDAIIAFTPLVVLLLAPVHALIDLLETRALIGSAAVGLGGAEALILGVPALLGTVWAFTYLAQARRPGGSISRGALGLDTIRQGGRSFVVQTPTPAGRASRQRRGRLVRLLLTVTMFVVSVTAMTGWVLSYDPSDAAARIGGWTQGEARLTEAETRSRAVIDDYYDALRRRLVDAALSYYGDAQGESFEALYPVELLDGFAYEEILQWEMRAPEGVDANAEPFVVSYSVQVAEYFGDPAHPDRRRVVTYLLEYRADRSDYASEVAEVRWVRVTAEPLKTLK